jgi:hypothetical protein
MYENRPSYSLLVAKPEGKRPLGRKRRRWIDNIKKDLEGIGWSDVDAISLSQDRYRWRALMKAIMNFRVPYHSGKFSSDYTTDGLSSGIQFR